MISTLLPNYADLKKQMYNNSYFNYTFFNSIHYTQVAKENDKMAWIGR